MASSLPPRQEVLLLPARASSAPAVTSSESWRYVDESRTHEVHASLDRGNSPRLVVRERAPQTRDPLDAYESAAQLDGAWEVRLQVFALERRLALLGNYYRLSGEKTWSPLRRGRDAHQVNLDPLLMQEDRRAEFHWYGSRSHDVTALLVATRVRVAGGGARYHLSRVLFRFPDVAQGQITVLHPRLPAVLLRSVLAQHDLDYQELGMEKLVYVDRSARGNAAWCADLDACLAEAQSRIFAGAFGGTAPRIPHPSDATGAAGAAPKRRAYHIEDAEPPPAERKTAEAAKVENVELSWSEALTHPRLVALHRRYLAPGEEKALVAAGDLAIRKFITVRRGAASADEQHFISILEASLLTRYALGPGGTHRINSEMTELLRRAIAYL